MPAPYLKCIWLEPSRVTDPAAYPYCLPFLQNEFELSFDRAVTVIVGENGMGKSTLLEGIAVAGYDEAGGGKSYFVMDTVKRCRRREMRVAVAAPTNEQVFSLVRSIADNEPCAAGCRAGLWGRALPVHPP